MSTGKSQAGFSLVETLVAITILLIVIAGPLAISSSAAKSSSFSSEQVVAFFLAQEGLELAEKARDDLLVPNFATTTSSYYNPDPWADFTRTVGSATVAPYKNCFIAINAAGCDFTIGTNPTGTLAVTNCGTSATACSLYLDKSTSALRARYTHASNGTTVPTPYSRSVTFEPVNANEVKVVSKVTWRTGALKQQQEASVESRFFNVYGTN